jgi:hypothetical protein
VDGHCRLADWEGEKAWTDRICEKVLPATRGSMYSYYGIDQESAARR